MPAEALASAAHVSRYYGHHCAVDDLSLTLRRGEVLGLLGPNGAGKSSTLQMLSGNLAPSRGRITINGIDLLDSPKAAKTHIGYLPERPPLYPDLSVDEYLRYCARLHRIPAKRIHAAMGEVKARCGLADVGRRLIGNLSKGFQQRVGIAQALIHTPLIVILDEPTVGLDPIQIREIRALIRELGREHAVILSTHILPEVQAVCDRVQIMHQGRTVFDSPVDSFGQRQQSPATIVSFKSPPTIEVLRAVSGIDHVERLVDDRLRVVYQDGENAEALVIASVEHGWGLLELIPERTTLEQIFMDLVHRDLEHTAADGDHAREETA